jgi:hypothetical protein
LKRANLRRKWSTIRKQHHHLTISRHASPRGCFLFRSALWLYEIALVLVRLNHVASFIGAFMFKGLKIDVEMISVCGDFLGFWGGI